MRGGWELQSVLALSSHCWVVSGPHFHLEKHGVFLQELNHHSPDPLVERSSIAR